MASRAPSSAMASRAPSSAMSSQLRHGLRHLFRSGGPRPVFLSVFVLRGLQSAHPPSPVELLRRGTRLPGGGSYVRVLLCVMSCLDVLIKILLFEFTSSSRVPVPPSYVHHDSTLMTGFVAQGHIPISYLIIVQIRAVQLIACDSHAHLVSKAGSVIGAKSPSPAFKWSGS